MARVAGVLLVLAMLCAMGVVTSQHRARKVFVDLEAEQSDQRKLDEEFTQLTLEQSTWATNKRIDSIAAKSLGMRLPDASNTVIVTPDGEPVSGKRP
ncbi:MAG TPA: cell division protein FtsL [Usitatibacter sp.]|jgi:cell division protein FtsL|nr:cell division protein FtsL [Usitatibacter sp.]